MGLIDSWVAAKKPVEFHLYGQGGHGFGMYPKGVSGGFHLFHCKEPPCLATTRAWCEMHTGYSLRACAEFRTPGNEVIGLDEGAAGPRGNSEVAGGCSLTQRLGAP